MPTEEFKSLLEKTFAAEKSVCESVDNGTRKKVRSLLAAFKIVARGRTPKAEQMADLLEELRLDPQVLAHGKLNSTIRSALPRSSDAATRNISIKVTTIPSSKRLAEDYVFITDFDDRFFLEKDDLCSDQKIFDFLVALTRARRKVYLISSEAKEPKFLTWISKERIKKVRL